MIVGIILFLGALAGIGVGIYFCVKAKKKSETLITEGAEATTVIAAPGVATANAEAYAPPPAGTTTYQMQNMVAQPAPVLAPAMAGQPAPVVVQAPTNDPGAHLAL